MQTSKFGLSQKIKHRILEIPLNGYARPSIYVFKRDGTEITIFTFLWVRNGEQQTKSFWDSQDTEKAEKFKLIRPPNHKLPPYAIDTKYLFIRVFCHVIRKKQGPIFLS